MSFRGLVFPLAATAAILLAACSGSQDNGIRVEHTPKDEPPPANSAGQQNATAPQASAASPSDSSLSEIVTAAAGTELPPGHPAIPASSSPPLSAVPGQPGAPVMSGGPGMQALPGMAEFTASTPTPQWSVPADWVADPPNPVRKGSWTIAPPAGSPAGATAEISVNVFAGQLGGLLANVNRWRGQVGLEPTLTDAILSTCVANISIGGRAAQLVTLDGPDGRSLSGALVFQSDRVWSFRMTGPTPAVTAQRPAFRAFLDSVVWPN